MLTWRPVKSCIDLSKPENSESGDSWLGVGPPLVIGDRADAVRRVLMLLVVRRRHREFFGRKPEVADPGRSRTRRRAAGRDRGRRLMAATLVVGYDGTPGARAAAAEALGWRRRSVRASSFAFAYWTNPAGGEVGDMLERAARAR